MEVGIDTPFYKVLKLSTATAGCPCPLPKQSCGDQRSFCSVPVSFMAAGIRHQFKAVPLRRQDAQQL